MAKIREVNHVNEPVEKSLGFAASVLSNGTVHVSGIVAVDAAMAVVAPGDMAVVAPGDMAGQITAVYDGLAALLAGYEATLENVVSETIFVTDMQAFAGAADVRKQRYARWGFPASTAVQVAGLFMPGLLIEVQAIATLP